MKCGSYSILQRTFALLLTLVLVVGMLPPVQAHAATATVTKGGVSITVESDIFEADANGVHFRNAKSISESDVKNMTGSYEVYKVTLVNNNETETAVTVAGAKYTLAANGGTQTVSGTVAASMDMDAATLRAALRRGPLAFLEGCEGNVPFVTVLDDAGKATATYNAIVYISESTYSLNYVNRQGTLIEKLLPMDPADPKLKLRDAAGNEVSELTYDPGNITTYQLHAGSNGSGLSNVTVTGAVEAVEADSWAMVKGTGAEYTCAFKLTGNEFGTVTFAVKNDKFYWPWNRESENGTLTITVKGQELPAEAQAFGIQLYKDGSATTEIPAYKSTGFTLGVTEDTSDATVKPAAVDCEYTFSVTGDAVELDQAAHADTYTYAEVKAGNGPAIKVLKAGKATVTVTKKARGYEDFSKDFELTVNPSDEDVLKTNKPAIEAPYGVTAYTIDLASYVNDIDNGIYTVKLGEKAFTQNADKSVTVSFDENGITGSQELTVVRSKNDYYTEKTASAKLTLQPKDIGTYTGTIDAFKGDGPANYTNKAVTIKAPANTKISETTTAFADEIIFAAEDLTDGKNDKAVYIRTTSGEVQKVELSIYYDGTAPELTIADPTGGNNKVGHISTTTYYLGQSVTYTVTPADAASGISKVAYKLAGGEYSEIQPVNGVYSATFTENNTSGQVYFQVTDKAGNVAEFSSKANPIYVDNEVPTGEVVLEELNWKSLLNGSWIYNLLKGEQKVIGKFKDNFSKAENLTVSYYIDQATNETDNQYMGEAALDRLSADQWKAGSSVSLPKDSRAAVYFKVVDEAGNVAYFSSTGLIHDTTNPYPGIEDDTAPEFKLDSVMSLKTFDVHVKSIIDPDTRPANAVEGTEYTYTYSGIQSVSIEIADANGVELTTGGTSATVSNEKLEENFTLKDLEKVQTMPNQTFSLTVPQQYENTITATVTVTDNAGLSTQKEMKIQLDNYAPRIEVVHAYDSNTDAAYYKDGKPTVTVTVNDKNFDDKNTAITVTQDGSAITSTWSDWTAAGNGKHTATWTPDADGDYEITVTSTDKAGNKTENVTNSFILDETLPKVTLISGEPNYTVGSENQYDNTTTVRVQVEERNFDEKNVSYSVTGGEYTAGEWTSNGDIHTLPLTFEKDGHYTVTVNAYTDNAGNQSKETSVSLAVDTVAPTGTISQSINEGTVWTTLLETLTFGLWERDAITVTAAFSDATTAVNKSYYYIDSSSDSGAISAVAKDAPALANAAWTQFANANGGDVGLSEKEAQYVVYFKAVDNVGNTTYFSTDGMILDKPNEGQTGDAIITITLPDAGTDGFYTENVEVGIKVEEPVVNSSYAGLQSVTYVVETTDETTGEKKTTQSGTLFTFEMNDPTAADLVQSINKTVTIEKEKNDSNNVSITVTAVDNAGNTSKAAKNLMLDMTKPVVNVTYDNDAVIDGKYFAGPRTATITVTEKNFDAASWSGLEYTITSSEAEIPVLVPGESKGDVHTAAITFSGDSDYTFQINSVTDLGGNKQTDAKFITYQGEAVNTFVVDNTKPTVAMSMDDGATFTEDGQLQFSMKDAGNNTLTQRTATITIVERNFQSGNVAITITKNGKEVDSSTYMTTWKSSKADGVAYNHADVHKLQLVFTEDADYTIDVANYTDRVGHTSEEAPALNIAIDSTAPTGTISQSVSKTTWTQLLEKLTFGIWKNEKIKVHAIFEDATTAVASKWFYKVSSESGRITDIMNADAVSSDSIAWKELTGDVELDKNGQYVVYFKAVDNVGNTSYFSTDGIIADGNITENQEDLGMPQITIEPVDFDKLRNEFYTKDLSVDITVTDPEINNSYSGLKSVSYKIQDTKTGKELYKFEPTEPLTFDQLKQTFTDNVAVDAEAHEGNEVVFVVTAEDNAGNISTASKTLKIDVTKPVINLSFDNTEADSTSFYKEQRVATITVTEKNFDWSDLEYETTSTDTTDTPELVPGESKGDVHTATITFAADSDYTLTIKSVKDLGGNVAEGITTQDSAELSGLAYSTSFTVDKTKPVATLAMDDAATFVAGDQLQFNMKDAEGNALSKRTATVTVLEHNFDPSRVEISITKTVTKNGVQKDPVTEVKTYNTWSHSSVDPEKPDRKDNHTLTLEFRDDADYVINVTVCKDKAGNEFDTIDAVEMAIDSSAPYATISQNIKEETVWTQLLETLTFGLWKNKTIQVTSEFSDDTTAVKETYYYIVSSMPSKDEENGKGSRITRFLTLEELQNLGDEDWTELTGDIKLDNEAQYVVYFKAVDNVNNTSYFSTDGIIYDTTKPGGPDDGSAPQVVIDVANVAEPRNGIYITDVPMLIDVLDPEVNNSYSGLKSVTYEITADGKQTATGTLQEFNADEFNEQNPLTFDELEQDLHEDVTVNASQNDSNNVVLTVTAVDNAGNSTTVSSDSMKIDVTKPVVTVTYDNNEVENEKYFKEPRIATITVKELNFSWTDVELKIESSVGETITLEPGVSEGDVHKATVTFANNSDYTFEVLKVMDLGGNVATSITYEGVAPNEFTVDTIKPVLDFELTGEGNTADRYYSEITAANLIVEEHNHNERGVRAEIGFVNHSGDNETPILGEWQNINTDIYSAAVTPLVDGIYNITADYTDLAGNLADTYVVPEFVLDTVDPEVNVAVEGSTVDNISYAGEFRVTITIQDNNLDIEKTKIVMTVNNLRGLVEVEPTSVNFNEGTGTYTIVFEDPAVLRENDGLYHLSIEAVDKAGRTNPEESKEYDYIVNRFGSVYYADDPDTRNLLENGFTNQAPTLEIIEINPNELKDYEIEFSVSGNVYTLKEDTAAEQKDFSTIKSTVKRDPAADKTKAVPALGWHKHIYTIHPSAFMENEVLRQGSYTVILSSEDMAENLNSSTSFLLENQEALIKEKVPAQFDLVIDAEQPTVVIAGIEDNGIYDFAEMSVQLTVDDANLKQVMVQLIADYGTDKEREIDSFPLTKEDLQNPIVLTQQEGNPRQTLVVTASDAAGNVLTSQVIDVTISTDFWVQILRSDWLIPSIIALICAFACGMYLLYRRNQKKRSRAAV